MLPLSDVLVDPLSIDPNEIVTPRFVDSSHLGGNDDSADESRNDIVTVLDIGVIPPPPMFSGGEASNGSHGSNSNNTSKDVSMANNMQVFTDGQTASLTITSRDDNNTIGQYRLYCEEEKYYFVLTCLHFGTWFL